MIGTRSDEAHVEARPGTHPESMETMQEAIARLEACGFDAAFHAAAGGRLGVRRDGDEASYAAESLVVEEVVRFEGQSDPDDQAVLFALATPDERFRGTFVAAYGPQLDAATVAAVEALEAGPEHRTRHTRPGNEVRVEIEPGLLSSWIQDALTAERFVQSSTAHLLTHEVLAADAQAALLMRLLNERAGAHVEEIARLQDDRDESPSAIRGALAAGLGATLGFVERLPSRDLAQIVRDVYVALNYTAGCYHVLYTRAKLLGRGAAAELALRHLREYTPVVRQLSHLMAWASALDLPPDRWQGSPVMKEIVDTLLESWSPDAAMRADPGAASSAS